MKNTARRRWTKEEEDLLRQHWGRISVEQFADMLSGRTIASIRWKAWSIGLSNYLERDDGLTVSELAEIADVNRSTIMFWIKENGLPARKKMISKRFWFYVVDPIDFREWTKNYQKRRKRRRWTKEEDKQLIRLLREFKYTVQDLSEILGRSENGIRLRIHFLNLLERPIPEERRRRAAG